MSELYNRHVKQDKIHKYVMFGAGILLAGYLLISGCPRKAEQTGQEKTPASKLGLERIIHDENPVKQV